MIAGPSTADIRGLAIALPVPDSVAIEARSQGFGTWRGRLPALALAAIVHVLAGVAIAYLFTNSVRSPGPHSVAVTLISAMGATGAAVAPPSAAAPSAATTLESLQARLAEPLAAPSPTAAMRREPAASSLAEILGEAAPRRSGSPAAAPGAKSAPAQAGGAGDGPDPYAYASLSADGAKLAASRSVRDQVARCWRRTSPAAAITLNVTLDDRGQVVGSPTAGGGPLQALKPGQSQALAQAVAAVRACAPYVVAARGPTAYEIDLR